MSEKLIDAINNSNFHKNDRDKLLASNKVGSLRTDLNIFLIKKLFTNRVDHKKVNYAEHHKLNYIYDEKLYAKECTKLIKKMKD